MKTVTLSLSGLTCQACGKRVRDVLLPLADDVQIALTPSQIATVSGAKVAPEVLIDVVANTGKYSARLADAIAIDLRETAAPVALVAVPAKIPLKVAKRNAEIPAAQNPPGIAPQVEPTAAQSLATYKPLLILTAFLIAIPALAQVGTGGFDFNTWMRHFMAAFFLAFSFFKLLDVRAFADTYAGYDLLAAKWKTWGIIYPFAELALGVAYLINVQPQLINAVTLLLMLFSLAGVVRAVRSKQKIRCACLGAVFNLPMSTVTIFEDALMAAMAGWMLLA